MQKEKVSNALFTPCSSPRKLRYSVAILVSLEAPQCRPPTQFLTLLSQKLSAHREEAESGNTFVSQAWQTFKETEAITRSAEHQEKLLRKYKTRFNVCKTVQTHVHTRVGSKPNKLAQSGTTLREAADGRVGSKKQCLHLTLRTWYQ